MLRKINIDFAKSKQDRSKKTLEDIIEAASNLLEQANPKLFTSRMLALKAGYSLGTLNKRLISVDNVFIWLIRQSQKHHIKKASDIIADFDANAPIRILVEDLVDLFFEIMNKINPKVIIYYENRIALNFGLIEDYDRADNLVNVFLETAKRNTTGTFREIDSVELRFILRASLSLLERPFVSSDPIAGTDIHRRIAVENCVRMLGT